MKTKNVRSSGVQVSAHFLPTLGSTTVSRMNSTPTSSTFIGRVGTSRLLPDRAAHERRHDHEDQRGDQPEHEHVLGDREVDPADRRQVNQRVFVRAVRDVADDHLAGVELAGGGVGFLRACSDLLGNGWIHR